MPRPPGPSARSGQVCPSKTAQSSLGHLGPKRACVPGQRSSLISEEFIISEDLVVNGELMATEEPLVSLESLVSGELMVSQGPMVSMEPWPLPLATSRVHCPWGCVWLSASCVHTRLNCDGRGPWRLEHLGSWPLLDKLLLTGPESLPYPWTSLLCVMSPRPAISTHQPLTGQGGLMLGDLPWPGPQEPPTSRTEVPRHFSGARQTRSL